MRIILPIIVAITIVICVFFFNPSSYATQMKGTSDHCDGLSTYRLVTNDNLHTDIGDQIGRLVFKAARNEDFYGIYGGYCDAIKEYNNALNLCGTLNDDDMISVLTPGGHKVMTVGDLKNDLQSYISEDQSHCQ